MLCCHLLDTLIVCLCVFVSVISVKPLTFFASVFVTNGERLSVHPVVLIHLCLHYHFHHFFGYFCSVIFCCLLLHFPSFDFCLPAFTVLSSSRSVGEFTAALPLQSSHSKSPWACPHNSSTISDVWSSWISFFLNVTCGSCCCFFVWLLEI